MNYDSQLQQLSNMYVKIAKINKKEE